MIEIPKNYIRHFNKRRERVKEVCHEKSEFNALQHTKLYIFVCNLII